MTSPLVTQESCCWEAKNLSSFFSERGGRSAPKIREKIGKPRGRAYLWVDPPLPAVQGRESAKFRAIPHMAAQHSEERIIDEEYKVCSL